jgi:hypothetical protein
MDDLVEIEAGRLKKVLSQAQYFIGEARVMRVDLGATQPICNCQIYVSAITTVLSYSDIAPLLDELNTRYAVVETSASSHEPPAAGLTEIALIITASGAAIYLKAFLEAWAAEDARAIRTHLASLTQKGRKNRLGRHFVPFRIELGAIRFSFHERLSDEDEVLERLRAAVELVQSLPDEAFQGSGGPGEMGLWWDRNRREWRGSIGTWGGEFCLPEGVLSDEPGDLICYESEIGPAVQGS